MASIALPIPKHQLDEINAHLSVLTPEEILQWSLDHLPGLYQTTAFGLTGLVAIDMLSKITSEPPPLIFLDTLYHFPETYELVNDVKRKYDVPIHVYKPKECDNLEAFEAKYGQKLWDSDEDTYDFVVKVRYLVIVLLRSLILLLFTAHAGRTRTQSLRRLERQSSDNWTPGDARRG